MPYEGEIDELIKRLQKIAVDAQKRGVRFASSQLKKAGAIYERYGYNAARLYLVSRDSQMEHVLVEILDEIQRKKLRPELGALILRRLDSILKYEETK